LNRPCVVIFDRILIEHERRVVDLLYDDEACPRLLESRIPGRYSELRKTLGEAFLEDLQRRVTLYRIDRCWAEHLGRIAEIRERIQSAEITGDGVSLPDDGIDGPASTWTYLINDNPFGTWLERAARGIRGKLLGR